MTQVVRAAKKITVKGICGPIKMQKLLEGVSEHASVGPTIWLMEIVGICTDYKLQMTQLGESVKFLGRFSATNLVTGEVTESGACYLPGAMPDLLYGALGPNSVKAVQFGFRVGAHFDESAIAKYVYDVESTIQHEEDDPLARMRAAMVQSRPVGLLAAPAPAANAPIPANAGETVHTPAPDPDESPEPEPEPIKQHEGVKGAARSRASA